MKYFFENPWFIPLSVNLDAKIRLFCFHCAGGSASFFRSWAKGLPVSVEVIGVQLPGREGRFSEKTYDDLGKAVRDLVHVLPLCLDVPFIFFGHSLGALLAFESTRALRNNGYALPCHLIVSGAKGPHLSYQKKKIHHLKDTDFISEIVSYNGISPLVSNNKDLLEMFIPTMRADFALSENYIYYDEAPLECPISSFGGRDDPYVGADDLLSWATQTINSFERHIFEGDHFFLENKAKDAVTKTVNSIVQQYL